MKLKKFFYVIIMFAISAGCNKQILEPDPQTQVQTQTNQLKAASIGTKYYISKTGNDSNPGTILSPFLTIQKGLNVAKGGDSVFVKAGIYNEYVNFAVGGTNGNPVVLKNYGTDVVTVDAQKSRCYCIWSVDKGYFVVDGINCINATAVNIYLTGCNNVVIKNLSSTLPIYSTFAAGSGKGIYIGSTTNWGTDITIKNVNSTGSYYPILVGSKVNRLNIIGGRYSYGSIDGINIQNSGMTISDTANISRNIVVDGVETDHNLRQGINTWGVRKATFKNFYSHDNSASGIQIENYSYNITIEDFICENNCANVMWTFETGVWIDDTDSCTVRRGIMRGNSTGFRVGHSKNVLAYNLLIYNNNRTLQGTTVNNSSGVDFYSDPSDGVNNLYTSHVELYNSVIFNNANSYSQRASVNIRDLGTYILKNNIISSSQSTLDIFRVGSHTLISDNNLIYNKKDVNILNLTSLVNWSGYKTATGQDAHSINADPLFINADFKLQSISPAINAGVNVGLISDYAGNPMTNLPDIGAYKYQGQSPTIYYNSQISAMATKNDCGAGSTGSTVTYTISAKKYSSTISQTAADNLATTDLNANKQAYANANGSCTAETVIPFGASTIGKLTKMAPIGFWTANSYIASSNINVKKMNIYVGTATGKARLGIYSSINGEPGVLLSQTEEISLVNGWNSGALASSQNLISGVTYWLAIELTSSLTTMYYNYEADKQRFKSFNYTLLPYTAPPLCSSAGNVYSVNAN